MPETFILSSGEKIKVKDHSGVGFYTEGLAVFKVYYPENLADCRHCNFCRYNKDFNTFKCILTEEYLPKDNLDFMGKRCPIIFKESDNANS